MFHFITAIVARLLGEMRSGGQRGKILAGRRGRGQGLDFRGALCFAIDIHCIRSAGHDYTTHGRQRHAAAEVQLQKDDGKEEKSQGLKMT